MESLQKFLAFPVLGASPCPNPSAGNAKFFFYNSLKTTFPWNCAFIPAPHRGYRRSRCGIFGIRSSLLLLFCRDEQFQNLGTATKLQMGKFPAGSGRTTTRSRRKIPRYGISKSIITINCFIIRKGNWEFPKSHNPPK